MLDPTHDTPPPYTAHGGEAEAEAVLLVLGARLEWKPNTAKPSREETEIDDKRYEAFPSCTYVGCFSTLVFSIDGRYLLGGSRTEYATYAAAKLACERHHATGKWEG